MTHVFSLEDLARCAVSLEFTNENQPPSIQWNTLMDPIDQFSSLSLNSLSIGTNISFTDGKPSLKLFLCHNTLPCTFDALSHEAQTEDEEHLYNANNVDSFQYPVGNEASSSSTDSLPSLNGFPDPWYHDTGLGEISEPSQMSEYQQSQELFQFSGFNGLLGEGHQDSNLYQDPFSQTFFPQSSWGHVSKTWSAASSPDSTSSVARSESFRGRRRFIPVVYTSPQVKKNESNARFVTRPSLEDTI
ncbi:hypothetical protein K435DRAFT_910972 [Dendrothele bispora CBS 962.96]|uniref:Uncharacterized protein n=1 Tax=Dendrothele bispora (strain CBS 962.96) TaxID=1314807 RepID=A0A4S8LMK6_DENBC|nr:hypothetical protein K435DRAFT_910972 [Dendrothele bispora CBS 962.96]